MPKRYHRKCLKWCSIAMQQRRSGYTGAFFLWKNNGCDDIIIGVLCRGFNTRKEG